LGSKTQRSVVGLHIDTTAITAQVFTEKRYARAVYAVVVCLSLSACVYLSHSGLYWNG